MRDFPEDYGGFLTVTILERARGEMLISIGKYHSPRGETALGRPYYAYSGTCFGFVDAEEVSRGVEVKPSGGRVIVVVGSEALLLRL